jgi:high-affinity Fe2+/Pb2+ permease
MEGFSYLSFFAGVLFGFLLFIVASFFIERYRLRKAFKKFDADMKHLRETMLRSNDAEEIADAYQKYARNYVTFKNY